MSKIVVIGANHAGVAAVNFLTNLAKQDEIIVYDRNDNLSFLACGMALWVGKQIDSPEGLFYSSKEKLEEKGAKVYMQARITRIDFHNKKIYGKFSDETNIEQSYDKLILATGSVPIYPDIPGINLENVQWAKLYQDSVDLIKKLGDPKIKRVCVVGGGYIGVELAEAVARHGQQVTLIDKMPNILSSYYDEDFSNIMRKNLELHSIDMALGQSLIEIKGRNKVEEVVTDRGRYQADMVIICIGFKPNTDLGKHILKTTSNGAYIVDKRQRTSRKDVYAIGDCASIFYNALGKEAYIPLATNAVRTGIIAAHNVAGVRLDGIGFQGSSGIDVYDLKMVSTGLTYARAKQFGMKVDYCEFEDLQLPTFMKTFNAPVKVRIVYKVKDRVIVGAQMISKYDISMGIHMFSLAIQQKVTIDEIKLLDLFFLPHFNQPYNYITMAAMNAR